MLRALLAGVLTLASGSAMAEYSFEIHNNSDQRIIGLEASDDGSSWGEFDVGGGIASGETETMVWDASTDDGACEWDFRATFEEGYVSEPVTIDFCEDELYIEFEF